MDEALEKRIARVLSDPVEVVAYDPGWPHAFAEEAQRLRRWLPDDVLGRIDHFGSTAVPGLAAKPVVDMLVEVTSLDETRRRIVPVLESKGYEYFWRPVFDDRPPFYAWFIRYNRHRVRTHHIHMVESDSELWERLRFRDYLAHHPDAAAAYARLKHRLGEQHPDDRLAYTYGKTAFIDDIMERIRRERGTAPTPINRSEACR